MIVIGLRLIILIIDIQLAKMFSGDDMVSLLRAISSSIITVPSQVTELIRYEIPSDHASFKSTLYSKTGYGGLDEAFSRFLMGTGIPSHILDDPDMGVADTLLNGVMGHFQEHHLHSSETIRAELFVLAITGKTGIDGSVFQV